VQEHHAIQSCNCRVVVITSQYPPHPCPGGQAFAFQPKHVGQLHRIVCAMLTGPCFPHTQTPTNKIIRRYYERAAGAGADREHRAERLPLQPKRPRRHQASLRLRGETTDRCSFPIHCSEYGDFWNHVFGSLPGQDNFRIIVRTWKCRYGNTEFKGARPFFNQANVLLTIRR